MTRPPEFDAAVVRYRPFLCRIASRFAAPGIEKDDLVQATVEDALSNWTSFRPGGPMATWLSWRMRHVANLWRAKQNTRKRFGQHVPIDDALGVAEPPQQESALYVRQVLALADRTSQGQAIRLLTMGFTQVEIAQQRGVSKQAVNQSLHKALRALPHGEAFA